jgi:hypothetical protein
MSLAHFFERVLTAPTMEQPPTHDTTFFVRETMYPRTVDYMELFAALHDAQLTGRVIFDLSQGTVQAIRTREEVKVDLK